jgi:hypothetical protein
VFIVDCIIDNNSIRATTNKATNRNRTNHKTKHNDADTKSVFTYTVECPVLDVTLAKSGDYFAVKMID